ncbi:MAG: divalent-cation tolerance protein CutA [Planctomycetia bacterium]|nr:divalent-cation tolerance protein CutA [Planctomycetia bacterium]
MESFVEIIFTHDDPTQALQMIRQFVQARLVACGQMIPEVTSVYFWNGKLEESRECRVTLKTRASLREKVSDEIRRAHTYDVPEIISREILIENRDYAQWILENTCFSSEE